jgi:hypothetical protein
MTYIRSKGRNSSQAKVASSARGTHLVPRQPRGPEPGRLRTSHPGVAGPPGAAVTLKARGAGPVKVGAGARPAGRGPLQDGEEKERSDQHVPNPGRDGLPLPGGKSQGRKEESHDPTLRGDGTKAPPQPSRPKPGLASDEWRGSHPPIIALWGLVFTKVET